tara:strand:- start:258 stop:974 length:717 start_codon:yes stop_codon:yes gene_type:complete
MKITKAEYSGPDGDDDVNFDFELTFENSSDHDIESVKTSCLITNQDGAVVGGSYGDEQDVFIEPGETEAFDLYCSYLKGAHFGGNLAGSSVLIDATFYRAEFHKLGEHEVPSSSDKPNIVDNGLEIGDMLKIFKTGIFLDAVNDEGEVGMEVRIGVRNVSDVHFEKVEVKAELLDKRGSEVDTSQDYQVLNAFSSSFLNASFWGLKPSRLKGCSVKLSLLVHQPIAYGSQTAELSKEK